MSSGPTSALESVPSLGRSRRVTAEVAAVAPSAAGALGVPVTTAGAVPPELGLDRGALTTAGFEGEVGQALALPGTGAPMLVAFGVGDGDELDVARLRDAAAAFATALPKQTNLAVGLPASGSLPADRAAAALVEGMLLGRYS
ncbi:MAG: M17 family peptidase N-terminal domain-containing protein, partial [Solirubrobacteraceae bacterium]